MCDSLGDNGSPGCSENPCNAWQRPWRACQQEALRGKFIHGEVFSGFLVGLAKDSLLGATRQGFDALNRAMKQRAELLR